MIDKLLEQTKRWGHLSLGGALDKLDELERELAIAINERDMLRQQRADWKAAHEQAVERANKGPSDCGDFVMVPRDKLTVGDCYRFGLDINEVRSEAHTNWPEKPDYQALYYELIYLVAKKWPNETRHQTAMRYIEQAEKAAGMTVPHAEHTRLHGSNEPLASYQGKLDNSFVISGKSETSTTESVLAANPLRSEGHARGGGQSLLRDPVTPPPGDPTKPLAVNKPRVHRDHPEDFGQ